MDSLTTRSLPKQQEAGPRKEEIRDLIGVESQGETKVYGGVATGGRGVMTRSIRVFGRVKIIYLYMALGDLSVAKGGSKGFPILIKKDMYHSGT